MAQLKVKILTDGRVKRRFDGIEIHTYVGINSESKLCFLSTTAELAAKLAMNKFVVMTNCRVNPKNTDDSIFIDTQPGTKVRCHFLFN